MVNPYQDPYLRHFSKQLIIVSLVKVHLVIDGFSHLSLAPLLANSMELSNTLPSFRYQTTKELEPKLFRQTQFNEHMQTQPTIL